MSFRRHDVHTDDSIYTHIIEFANRLDDSYDKVQTTFKTDKTPRLSADDACAFLLSKKCIREVY